MNPQWIMTGARLALSTIALAAIVRRIERGTSRALDEAWTARVGVRERGIAQLSILAEPRSIAIETAALALLPGLHRRERGLLIGAPLLAGMVGHMLKRLVPRDRPTKSRFAPKGDESFPSTHAANATALALAAAHVARCHGKGNWTFAAAAAAAALVGVARIRVAAHWPSDVIGGALLGLASADAARLIVGRR